MRGSLNCLASLQAPADHHTGCQEREAIQGCDGHMSSKPASALRSCVLPPLVVRPQQLRHVHCKKRGARSQVSRAGSLLGQAMDAALRTPCDYMCRVRAVQKGLTLAEQWEEPPEVDEIKNGVEVPLNELLQPNLHPEQTHQACQAMLLASECASSCAHNGEKFEQQCCRPCLEAVPLAYTRQLSLSCRRVLHSLAQR